MKRFIKVLFTVGSAALLFTTAAHAQVTSTSDPADATPNAAVDITLTGSVQSALVLTVSGTAGNSLVGPGAPVGMETARAAGSFAFGAFSTAQTTPLTNGRLIRAGAGAYAVASLVARVTITGSTRNASILMSTDTDATGGGSPIADGNVRFERGSLAWNAVDMGTNLALDAAGVEFCPAAGCATATDYAHDLALYIPDSQGPGAFTQVISYDASIL